MKNIELHISAKLKPPTNQLGYQVTAGGVKGSFTVTSLKFQTMDAIMC